MFKNVFTYLDVWKFGEDPTDNQIEETIETITETKLLPILQFGTALSLVASESEDYQEVLLDNPEIESLVAEGKE